MSIAINEDGVIKEIGVKTYDGFQITGYKVLLDRDFNDSYGGTDSVTIMQHVDLSNYRFLIIIQTPLVNNVSSTTANQHAGFGISDLRTRISQVERSDAYFKMADTNSVRMLLQYSTLPGPVSYTSNVSYVPKDAGTIGISWYPETLSFTDCRVELKPNGNLYGFHVFLMGIETT